jgi:hypothetical protein
MCTVLGGRICFAFEVVRPFFLTFATLVFEEATGGVLLSGVFIVVMLIFLWSGEEPDALHYIDDAFYRCDTQIKVGTIEV